MLILKKKKDKLIILGCMDTWKDAPFTDDSFEIWGMNYLWQKFEEEEDARADVWWEMHTLKTRKPEHLKWLKEAEMPIVMQEHFDEMPTSVKYPLDEIIAKYGRRYFLCTMCYQIALAMYMKYKEIHLYGFNMILGDDYIQRWSFEYWLGRAEQQGIKVFIPDDCDLLKSPALYGYEADNTLAVYIQKYITELQSRVADEILDIACNARNISESALSAMSKLGTLYGERTRFMKEIFDRHKLNPVIISDEEDFPKEAYAVILGVIPARGGSKGIPRKNLYSLNGRPLIDYTINSAFKSRLGDFIISTDDKEIAAMYQSIIRPPELAQDDTPMYPVIAHAVRKFEKKHGGRVDAVMTLQPTSPLRIAEDIDNTLRMFIEGDKDSLVSVCQGIHPIKSYIDGKPIVGTEPYDKHKHKCLTRNGAIFITRRNLLDTGRLWEDEPLLYEMPKSRSIDVDTMDDVVIVEALLKRSETH